MMNLRPGDRVHVKSHWNWPRNCSGVVAPPPPIAHGIAGEHPWHGHIRTVPGRKGPISSVWIVFDEPQKDGDDDGPYRGGEVELEFVTRVGEPSG